MNNVKMIGYAIIQIIDSLIILITLGFVTTTLPFNYLVWWEKKELLKKIKKMKEDTNED